ncbi:major facilitator superfamily domain-containing protein [Alternaria rosae]|uniref:major facilitator superfamily domain-containing protein n=1 Tax=Alternaria rosae TaxID=1187941 RepID=UPI001E8E1CDA|nr:major facilitator superfamily domain-containing protein [Alternaria rosae]KAH6882116.1 major facilitator superfamily domain-containing protein [Alternaria rosae]
MATQTQTATEVFELPPISKAAILKPISHPPRPSQETSSYSNHTSDTESSTSPSLTKPSTLRTFLTIFTPSFVGFIASFTNGIITVGLPSIARSIALERSLYLWPSSVYGLTSGAALLIAGSVADIVGARPVELVGILLLGVFTLACGFAQTGGQLVAFRALQGVALALHLPASVAIITGAVPSGRARNLGFACLGFSQPLGFAVGLVLSGVMIERAGWRSGFYLTGGCTLAVAVAALWTLPKLPSQNQDGMVVLWKKVGREIDWVGGMISSGGLAILAYVLAIISADLASIRSAEAASLLAISVLLLCAFPAWMHYRERSGKTALVPNKIWNSLPFTSTCIMVALSYGVMNSIELFSSLYFQEVQHASILATSLYLLPNLLAGVLIQISVGLFVHRVPARWLVAGSAFICAISPLLMAVVPPTWSYWKLAFWAQMFAPFSADVLFTVGLIIVSDNFPEKTQALAGAVFNTVAQFGMSLGMGSCQVVALGVQVRSGSTGSGGHENGDGGGAFEGQDDAAVLKGYRASYWLMFGYMVVCIFIAVVGLRKAGKVGLKRE